MIAQWLAVLRFELAFRKKHVPVYIFAGVCFLFGALTMGIEDGMSLFGGSGQILRNAPVAITMQHMIATLIFGLAITTAFVAPCVIRDEEFGISSLMMSTPLKKVPYLLGRFSGSMVVACAMMSCLSLGTIFASVMPWQDPERHAALDLAPYIYTQFVLIFPTLLIIGAIAFAAATLTRRLMYAYVALLGIYILYTTTGRFISDLDNETLAALCDPFGLRAYRLATRYFTTVESNHVAAPLSPLLLGNRLLWIGISGLTIAATCLRYRMVLIQPKPKKNQANVELESKPTPSLPPPPTPQLRYDTRAQLRACLLQLRIESKNLLKSTAFIVIALFGIGNLVGSSVGLLQARGTTTLPVTYIMLDAIRGGMSIFLLIVIVFYAGELFHRERRYNIAELYDALPISNWVPFLSKLGALFAAIAVLLVISIPTTILVQLFRGFSNIELSLYFFDVWWIQLPQWILLAMLAFVLQVFTNQKFIGYLAITLIFILQASLPSMGVEHEMFNFASLPGIHYSDMNGYGSYLEPYAVYCVYWFSLIVAMTIKSELFWPRGRVSSLKHRIRHVRATVRPTRFFSILVLFLCFVGTGAYIYYNTTILNLYRSSDDVEALLVRYEKEFRQYHDLAQPRVTEVDVHANLFPEELKLELIADLKLENRSADPIREIHLSHNVELKDLRRVDIPGADLKFEDRDLGYQIFELASPLQPGENTTLHCEILEELQGFRHGAPDRSLVENGSFINSGYTPHIGYNSQRELTDPKTRKEHGLPERERMPSIDDEDARKNTYIVDDSDWVKFRATVSTSPDQIAIAPGYLQKEWEENGRRFFEYEMDSPILNFWSILSARYEVRKETWTPPPGSKNTKPVALEVYYDKAHPYNVDKMIQALKASLDLYTVIFSPYQHRQVRILEFPNYATFAQSFPNTIPYSESIGFIADASDPNDIDYVNYVTAHEVAHQWWAHQVIGANVEGATLMSESLSQYSALLVMEKVYGPQKVPKFLRYELKQYLGGRSHDRHGERPLARVEMQPYIYYNKASLVFYALKEYIGADAVNAALSKYIEKVGFQRAPYTTSRELLTELRAITPERFLYLIEDLFEKITLYDNRCRKVESVKLDDGSYETTIEIQSGKYYADEKGHETPAPKLNDWIEIGVVIERTDASGMKYQDTIAKSLERIDQPIMTFKIRSDEKPTHAGIDPRILLIDRSPQDNLKPVP